MSGLGPAVNGRTGTATFALLLALVVPAACSSSSSKVASPATATSAAPGAGSPAAAKSVVPAKASPTSAATVSGSGCDSPVPAAVKAHVNRPEVTDVTLIGGCGYIAIATTLADTEGAIAQQICDSAAEVAYTGKIYSVSVTGKSNHELSIGMKGASCIGHP
jgi:hypothetical protein